MFTLIRKTANGNTKVLVVQSSRIVSSSGPNIRVKWGKRWYAAEALAKSDDKLFLQSVPVNDDGKIDEGVIENTDEIENNVPAVVANNLHDIAANDVVDIAADEAAALPVPEAAANQVDETNDIPGTANGIVSIETDDFIRNAPGEIELIIGSGVFISELDLYDIANKWKNDAREMTRRIIRSIVGVENLRTMTPQGQGAFEQIPADVVKATEQFVFMNVKKSARLTKSKFRRCLTQMCSNSRAKK